MKIRIKCWLCVLFVLTTIMLPGCKHTKSQKPTACAIVLGHHNNSMKIDTKELFNEISRDVFFNFGNLCIIKADGEPEVKCDENGFNLGRISENIRSKMEKEYIHSVDYWDSLMNAHIDATFEEILNIYPTVAEFDTLKAIQVAAEAVDQMAKEMGQNVSKKIVICDTGLPTSGSLNFLDETNCRLINYDGNISKDEKMIEKVSQLVSKLKDEKELDGLNGITIEWYGLGKVDDPQPELSNLCRSNLQYIWEEVLRAANVLAPEEGNYSSIFMNAPTEKRDKPYNLQVSVVNRYEVVDIPVIKVEGFKPGEDVFHSDATPNDILIEYCNDILDYYPNMEILVVGATASTKDGGSVDLADKRANKVQSMLTSLGIDSDRIKIIGLGANTPWHTNEYINGNFDDNMAQKNRAAYILPFESELAQRLYAGNY